ncbi:hypothetical protein [Amycolatopsis sp. EV170708-02-1]|uniref:hypothetical protein n=1 Tax=Amycolatopsis sp. EV170708-02-1 TaxID=2919322 RepID=UPI001F0C8722|nr:hypothetical protein [Amycolatopsis sp. EV170708-02-1]UMP06678.1 hypothetical protein MJQ72_18540 [Amycolatopsis sp. EV170708-02-1]
MGTNSKTAHASYSITPSAPAAEPEPLEAEPPTEVPGPLPDEEISVAVDSPEELGAQPLTPIPDTPDVGKPFGEPILVGGTDLHASSATLVSYASAEGPRTVLHALVSEEAEDKLLDAIHVTKETAPVQVEQIVHGRLPVDEQHELADKIIAAAKSVNHHIKAGDLSVGNLPSTTEQKINDAKTAMDAVAKDVGDSPGPADSAMLAHYAAKLADVEAAAAAAKNVGHVNPYLHEGVATVTVTMPVLASDTGDHRVAGLLRDATRIKPTLDSETGQASWNGKARWENVEGKEYMINLGDGFQAVYRPYSVNSPKTTEFSLRGRLEIIAPAGEGHGPDVVKRLGQLNLANRPMTRAEGEYGYLAANVKAQNLAGKTEVQAAITTGDQLEEMTRQELFHERAHLAIGLDDAQLARFAKDIQLDAHTQALPTRVRVLREAVAKVTGHQTGDALAATAGYDPAPRRSGGWLTWNRFDVGNSMTKLTAAFKGKALVHATSATGLKAMLANGVLASTERRTLMGVSRGVGMSEDQDKFTGGASSVFLRVLGKPPSHGGPKLVWDQPERLLHRADYYGANADTYGAVNPAKAGEYASSTRDPFKIAKFAHAANEVMFGDGIDLLGAEGPSRILCDSKTQRDEIHAMFTAKGITHIAGKPIDDVLKA